MTQEDAYRVMMGFAGRLQIKAWMQKTVTGDWDVTVVAPGHQERTFSERTPAADYYRQLRAEGHPRP